MHQMQQACVPDMGTYIRTPITAEVRAAVFAAWDDTCAYCRVRKAQHCDHIFPRARGGQDALENYAAACAPCNLMKSDMVLGEGILHIVQGLAIKKAPSIRKSLARPAKAARPVDPAPYLERLVTLRLDLTMSADEGTPLSEAELLARRAPLQAQVREEFGSAPLSALKEEISRIKGRLTASRRFRARAPLREELAQLRHAGGEDLEVARAAVLAEHAMSNRQTLDRAISLQRRRNAPRRPDLVTVSMTPELRDEFLSVLPVIQGDVPMQEIKIPPSRSPLIYDWARSFSIARDDVAWYRRNGTAMLILPTQVTPEAAHIGFKPYTHFFLELAGTLDTRMIQFPADFDDYVVPRAEDCRAVDHTTFLHPQMS